MSRTVRSTDNRRTLVWTAKDADEVETYHINFTDRLDHDAIASSAFSLTTAAGLTIDASEHDGDALASVTLSGGTEGDRGKILCRVVTSDGRTIDETVALPIRAR